ncbi:hypothetical protein [Roseateles sp. LYH14W]|uniref:Uncharacterized protein n=1 Tax=Pelomonas parva TaxID=3299032 RepID=A0ABW7F6B7_9BURK
MASSLKLAALTAALFSCLPLASAQTAATTAPTKSQVQEAMKSQLLAPPEGFNWQLYKNVVFLKPAAWKAREMTQDLAGVAMSTYATSPEDFSRTQHFELGATIELISGSQRIRGIPAKRFVLGYLKPIVDKHKAEDVLMFEQKSQGDVEQTFFRYRDAPPGLVPVIVHKFIIANNATDRVNVFTFESPVETWDDNWAKYGTPIISKLNLLPHVPSE